MSIGWYFCWLTNMHLLIHSLSRLAWGTLPLNGDRAELCEDCPHTHDGGIPRATLEQGVRSSQTKLCFPPLGFSHLLLLWELERN